MSMRATKRPRPQPIEPKKPWVSPEMKDRLSAGGSLISKVGSFTFQSAKYLAPKALIAALGAVIGIFWSGGFPIDIGPGPPSDIADTAFETHEKLWREAQGEKAKQLRSGELKSEADTVAWFAEKNRAAMQAAWTPVLQEEKNAFGGENWTPEKEAAAAEAYSGK